MQVREVWVYDDGRLPVYLLQGDDYQTAASSQVFPQLPIVTWVPELVQQALTTGISAMLRELRRRLEAREIEG